MKILLANLRGFEQAHVLWFDEVLDLLLVRDVFAWLHLPFFVLFGEGHEFLHLLTILHVCRVREMLGDVFDTETLVLLPADDAERYRFQAIFRGRSNYSGMGGRNVDRRKFLSHDREVVDVPEKVV